MVCKCQDFFKTSILTPHYEQLIQFLKALPGLGYRSAERIALHLLIDKTNRASKLIDVLKDASDEIGPCSSCGNLSESSQCAICSSIDRDESLLCIVESIPDLIAMERSGAYQGKYQVLHGKLSPIKRIGPDSLNLESLREKIAVGKIKEIILALGNDMEGEATCYYLKEEIITDKNIKVSRIGFGLPSGGNVLFADEITLRNALDSRTKILEG